MITLILIFTNVQYMCPNTEISKLFFEIQRGPSNFTVILIDLNNVTCIIFFFYITFKRM